MKLTVFDVGQGFCACFVADNGNVMLIDCGQNTESGFQPSTYLAATGHSAIQQLVVTNFDEDHVSDLPNIIRLFPPGVFVRNRSLSAQQLSIIKQEAGPLSRAMQSTVVLHEQYVHPVLSPPDFGILRLTTFYNRYPEFQDTNNLSLVCFLEYDGLSVLIPGDLERAGWLRLLERLEFLQHLSRVNVFVASHHGRESGYCKEVFGYSRPDVIIISDKSIVHETQRTLYGDHAVGYCTVDGKQRSVLTTRADGDITIRKIEGQPYSIATSKALPSLLSMLSRAENPVNLPRPSIFDVFRSRQQ